MLKALYLGGCRSGKSRLALKKANGMGEGSKFFLATCSPEDPEMQERVIRHQEDRGPDWITLEEPLQVRERIEDCNQKGGGCSFGLPDPVGKQPYGPGSH